MEVLPVDDVYTTERASVNIQGRTLEFEVAKLLPISSVNDIYEDVLSMWYDSEGGFRFVMAEYLWRYVIIHAYTDIDLPESLDDAYAYCYSEIWDAVIDIVSADQLLDLRAALDAVVEQREYRQRSKQHITEIMDDINMISQAMLNVDNLPEWLADNLSEDKHPLIKG